LGDNQFLITTLRRLSGRVTNESGEPISGALLRIEIIQNQFAQEGIVQTRSDSDGMYTLHFDLGSLPGSFAMSVATTGYIPQAIFFQKDSMLDGTLYNERDIAMQPLLTTTVVIEPEPILHHLGDNKFGGPLNSQFQRTSEGIRYERVFRLTQSQVDHESFILTMNIKGVDSNTKTALQINEGTIIDIPTTDSFGNFSPVGFRGFVQDHLRVGENVLYIESGFKSESDDYDDIEFINPLINFQ